MALQPLHILLALALALSSPALAHAQSSKAAPTGNCTTHQDSSTRPDCPDAITFLAKFQDALKQNDHDAVAELVNYPLATPDKKARVRSRAQLLANYDSVFNPQVLTAILKATADDVWGNYRGFMVGDGVIWFDAVIPADGSAPGVATTYPIKVITVNPAAP